MLLDAVADVMEAWEKAPGAVVGADEKTSNLRRTMRNLRNSPDVSALLRARAAASDEEPEQEHGPTLAEIERLKSVYEFVQIPRRELARLLNDNTRLLAQITETQRANTALVEERRELKRRVAELEGDLAEANTRADEAEDDAIAYYNDLADIAGPVEVTDEDRDAVAPYVPAEDVEGAARSRATVRTAKKAREENDRTAMVRAFFDECTPFVVRRDRPGLLGEEALRLRVSFLMEEFVEVLDALYDDRSAIDQIRAVLSWFREMSSPRSNIVGLVHELVDLAYVIEGFLIACGVDGSAVFRVVHEANMRKKGGSVVDGKLGKPPGWTPPDVLGELRRQGLAPPREGAENAPDDADRPETTSEGG